MTVCITEKPSVARDIAHVIGANAKREGYFEGNGYQVTWAYGHLCCLKEPEDYQAEWKKWDAKSLPIMPDRFGIKLIDNPSSKKQFRIICKLLSKATCIVNCGDAGQEGELIQRWIMQMAGARCTVKRLWISSLTETAIREGFRNLNDQSSYDRLYFAGLARACGDWLLGINATRLFTLRYAQSHQVLSIGRVQTPTLSLIVNRQKEIDAFHPTPYYVLTTVFKGVVFHHAGGHFSSKEQCAHALESIKGKVFHVTDVIRKEGKEKPPQLFDLTSLQVECNKRMGWSAEHTLNTLQSLYEAKLTTYPRVDTKFLPDDMYPQCAAICKATISHLGLSPSLLSSTLPKSRRVFDSSKITDHHAIIPTGMMPSNLNEAQAALFDLISRRFLAAFMEDCAFSSTTVHGTVGDSGYSFKASGKTILKPGWRELWNEPPKEDGENEGNAKLPPFNQGDHGNHDPKMQEKMTVPPKPFTEATLLQAMETAGRFVEDERIKEALKENGIGRPSSRASIIETLFKRGYIARSKRNLIPTPTGMSLIDTIQVPILKSCELTGEWEGKLRRIEQGTYDAKAFMDELKGLINSVVESVNKDSTRQRIVGNGKEAKPNRKQTARYRQARKKKR